MSTLIICLAGVFLCLCVGGLIIAIVKTCKPSKQKPIYAYVQGVIVDKSENPAEVIIRYVVHDQTYELKEKVKTKSENVKVGAVTVGQKEVPVTPAELGQMVIIQYDIKDPAAAFWVANR